ncbi:mitochondrial carrier domain-containing protein [Chaetomium tenue]|uniref:Mitochondrial carrier domain-containing protein n=1 Tax=Chaetomium tenue TaxID=1854479 RepID=A0ACB7PPL2_9PEZI|nr:mitochondrial carrier domain-containing protein [Chaetomium globosum]
MAPFATSVHAHGAAGQNHDIISDHGAAADLPNEAVEITAVQKMLSATSGSLLTGLLATPLDVVRVRWQSQGVTQPAIDFTKLALPTAATPGGAAFRPADLGVTACCREVFFTNNTSEVCLAGPRTLPQNSTPITNPGAASTIACAVEETQQRTFTSTFDGLRKIARNEGVTTLWRGLSPTLVMAIPANIIYFTGYEWLRFNRAGSPIARAVPDDYAPLVAGSAARILAATVVSPIELFRTRLQAVPERAATNPLTSTFRGIQDMVAAHGYRSLWRGLSLTLWRDVPFSGMYWWGYETIRGRLAAARERRSRDALGLDLDLKRGRAREAAAPGSATATRSRAWSRDRANDNHADTFTDSFIAGAASGGFASVVTMPFDVGKTRTQVFRDTTTTTSTTSTTAATSAAAAAPEERNMARLLWHIFRTEGLPGLFRGGVPRTLRVAPACAIMISSYEVGKRVFRGVNERALAERRGLVQGGGGVEGVVVEGGHE